MHHEFLPRLTALSLRLALKFDLDRVDCWKAFFRALPAGGLSRIKTFEAHRFMGFEAFFADVFRALVSLKKEGLETPFAQLTTFQTHGVHGQHNLKGIAAAVDASIFPSISGFTFICK